PAAPPADAPRRAALLLPRDTFSGPLAEARHAAASLRWIHVAAAGVDKLLFDDLRTSTVLVTNARGVFDMPIAEYDLDCVMAHDKHLHLTEPLRPHGRWEYRETTRVAGRHALVVESGRIGRPTRQLVRAGGLEVRGTRRRSRDDDEDFGTVVDSARLGEHRGGVDHLVMVAPLTGATRGMLGADELAALPDGAHVVNVGRGQLVDQQALTSEI